MNQKLTPTDRQLIIELVRERRRYAQKASALSSARIAEKFDIHPSTVKNVVRHGN